MLTDAGAIVGIVAGAIVTITAIVAVAKGGFNIFDKIGKIDTIENGVNALLLIHLDEIVALYKDKVKIVLNPTPSPFPDREELID